MARNKPYGDVAYADNGLQSDGKKRYPIDTKAHVQSAWSYINKGSDADKYTADQLAEVKSKIKAAAGKFGISIADETKSAEITEAVERIDTPAEKANPTSSAAPEKGTLQRAKNDVKTPVRTKKMTLTLDELREKLANAEIRIGELDEAHRDREMPETETREYDDLKTERDALAKRIEAVEKRMEAYRDMAQNDGGHVERTGHIPESRKVEDIYNLDEIRSRAYNTEDFVGLVRDNAKRALERAYMNASVDETASRDQIDRLLRHKDDQHGTLAKRILSTGSPLYARAWSKALAAGTPQILTNEEFRSMSLGTDGSGGYAVPFQLDPTIIVTNAGVINPLRSMARIEQIVGKEWHGVTSAGTTVSRAAEAAEATDNSFTLAQPIVRTNRVQGFVPFSYELAESWNQVQPEITNALQDAKDREEAAAFTTGNGTAPNAGGIIGTLPNTQYVNAGAGQTFAAAHLYNLENALAPRFRTPQAKFLANRGIYSDIRQFDTAGGAQLWQRVGAGLPSELLGYQSYESSVMASTVATGNLFLLFGDFQQFLIVDRIGMSVELIPQVFGTNNRPTGQRGIYAVWMNNSMILVPGAFECLIGVA